MSVDRTSPHSSPSLVSFYLVIVRFSYQNQLLVMRKLSQVEYTVLLRNVLYEGFAIFHVFNLHLYLHSTYLDTVYHNEHKSSRCQEMVWGSRSLALALRPVRPRFCPGSAINFLYAWGKSLPLCGPQFHVHVN